jgi:hypothetical protein
MTMKKIAPPGWTPHEIVHRVDGYFVDPQNPDRIPARAAAIIAGAMPGGDDTVADIKARVVARQRALEHRRKRQRAIINRMAMVRHA